MGEHYSMFTPPHALSFSNTRFDLLNLLKGVLGMAINEGKVNEMLGRFVGDLGVMMRSGSIALYPTTINGRNK